MKSRITGKPATKKTKEEFLEEMRIAGIIDQEEEIKLEKIRKSGKKKRVSEDEYWGNEIECRYCMNYNDENDSCNAGITHEEWREIHNSLDDCKNFNYVYELDVDE